MSRVEAKRTITPVLPSTGTQKSSFNTIAPFYDRIADVGTLGAVSRSKNDQLRELRAGDAVLYAGVGGGTDALAAAKAGADVTVVDLSAKMIAKTEARFEAAELDQPPKLVCGDIMEHGTPSQYDVVCANYFLNVFEPKTMREVLTHLASLVKPGGKLMVADFSGPKGNPIARAFQKANHHAAIGLFNLLAGAAIHGMHDPVAELKDLKLTIERETFFGPGGWYSNVVARKAPNPRDTARL